jgi:hypothetical protein
MQLVENALQLPGVNPKQQNTPGETLQFPGEVTLQFPGVNALQFPPVYALQPLQVWQT